MVKEEEKHGTVVEGFWELWPLPQQPSEGAAFGALQPDPSLSLRKPWAPARVAGSVGLASPAVPQPHLLATLMHVRSQPWTSLRMVQTPGGVQAARARDLAPNF